jgi:hypothetical protein
MIIKTKVKYLGLLLALVGLLLVPLGGAWAATGGPDNYGYRFVDSRNGGISYKYIELNHLSDDVGNYGHISGTDANETDPNFLMGMIELEFDFEFYGRKCRAVYPAANGYLVFDPTYPNYDNLEYDGEGLPSSSQPNAVVAPFWGRIDSFA